MFKNSTANVSIYNDASYRAPSQKIRRATQRDLDIIELAKLVPINSSSADYSQDLLFSAIDWRHKKHMEDEHDDIVYIKERFESLNTPIYYYYSMP